MTITLNHFSAALVFCSVRVRRLRHHSPRYHARDGALRPLLLRDVSGRSPGGGLGDVDAAKIAAISAFAARLRTDDSGLQLLPFPHERVENPLRIETQPAVERHCFADWLPSPSARAAAEISLAQVALASPPVTTLQFLASDIPAARKLASRGRHRCARASTRSIRSCSSTLRSSATKRRLRIEHAASGKTHDVVEKAQRSAQRVVLIVDLRIHVAAIRRRDHGGRGLIVSSQSSGRISTSG